MQEKKRINSKLVYTITIILLVVLTLGSLGFGAWALFRTKLDVNGRVTFNGTGNVLATISNGKINYQEVTNKMQGFSIDNEYGEDTNLNLPTWKNIDVKFDETGNDVPLTFTVTNNSEDKTLIVEMTSSHSTPNNVNMEVLALGQPYEDKVLISPNKSVEYMVLFSLDDVTIPGSIDNFSVSLNMRNARQDEIPTPTLEKLVFTAIDDTTCEVSAARTCSGDVVIPEEAVCPDGKTRTVTKIANSGFEGLYVPSVKMPDSIIEIGNNAFPNTYMHSITIPDNVVTIGDDAFQGIESFSSVKLGNSVESLGIQAFACAELRYINIPASVTRFVDLEEGEPLFSAGGMISQIVVDENNPNFSGADNVLFNKDKTTLLRCAETKKSYVIPSTVTSVENAAFFYCSDLTRIEIPESVKKIENAAFHYCSNLLNIDIPTSVTSLGYNAFGQCQKLKSVKVPAGVTSIQGNTFFNCINLTSVVLPEGIISIESTAFNKCTSLETINIPGSMTTILASNAFKNLASLKTLKIGEGITKIETGAFSGCANLESVSIPGTVSSIGGFMNFGIKNIELGEGITTIDSMAFFGCSNLTNITIPSSVTKLSSGAFIGCTNLATINFKKTSGTMEIESVFSAAAKVNLNGATWTSGSETLTDVTAPVATALNGKTWTITK